MRDGLVLGREGINRRRDHVSLRAVGPGGSEGAPREYERVDLLEVRAQERPGALGPLVGLVGSDVAAPDELRAGARHRGGETGRLRVVDQDDVVRTHEREQLVRIAAQSLLVVAPLRVAKGAAIPGRAVEPVVNALRDLEEAGVALDHEPADVEPRAASVGQQRLQHLGDAAARGGRVDVEDRSASHRRLGRLGNPLVASDPLGPDQRLQPGCIERLDFDFLEPEVLPDSHGLSSSGRPTRGIRASRRHRRPTRRSHPSRGRRLPAGD